MKKTILSCSFALIAFSLLGQNIPVDFETSGFGATWTWTTFENDSNPALEIIANPDPSGINSSATVAKFTALQTGQPFAGCETSHGAGIGTFTIDTSTSIIKIMVWKSVISDVGIKLVRDDDWSLGEIKVPNTITEKWEQLTFDFSAHIGLTYDQLVVFPDFDARTGDNVIYFDNVFGSTSTTTAVETPENASIKFFPNPAANELNLVADQIIEQIEICSSVGEMVFSRSTPFKSTKINIAHFSDGIYLIRYTVNGQTAVRKLVKE